MDTASAEQPSATASVSRVQAYRLAVELSERAYRDANAIAENPLLADVAPQLVRAAGSIAANTAEGYARRSPRDRIRFYEYALGSSEEVRAWYAVGRHALAESELDERIARLTSIRRLLLVMIRNERSGKNWNTPRRSGA